MIEVRVKRWSRGLVGEVVNSETEEGKDIHDLQTYENDFDTESIVSQVYNALAQREGISFNDAVMQYTLKVTHWESADLEMWMTIKEVLENHFGDTAKVDNDIAERLVIFYRELFYTTNDVVSAPREIVNMYLFTCGK